MKTLLLLFSLLPLLLCSCPDCEEEREWERRADEENHGCRSCSMIEILADGNCPIGYECKHEWKMTSNVLSPNDCSCSELRCANSSTILSVEENPVGKIRCKANEWTLLTDPTKTATSAVCAKSCGTRACQRQHYKQSNNPLYEALKVKEPSQNDPCASAECPKGFTVFDDEGGFLRDVPPTPLVCSSSGTWKFGADEERYVMCKKYALTTFEAIPVETCRDHFKTNCIHKTCSDGISETETSITCPPGECMLVIGKEDSTQFDYYDKAQYDNAQKKWIFYWDATYEESVEEMEEYFHGKFLVGCSTWCDGSGGCDEAKMAASSSPRHLRRQGGALASAPAQKM